MNILDYPQVFIVFLIIYVFFIYYKVKNFHELFHQVSELIEIKKIKIYKNEKDASMLRERSSGTPPKINLVSLHITCFLALSITPAIVSSIILEIVDNIDLVHSVITSIAICTFFIYFLTSYYCNRQKKQIDILNTYPDSNDIY
jgi:hypothetical protein